MSEIRDWHRPGPDGETYLCSSNPAYLQAQAINDVLGSDLLWWCQGLDQEHLHKMLQNSLCLGLYRLPSGPDRPDQGTKDKDMHLLYSSAGRTRAKSRLTKKPAP